MDSTVGPKVTTTKGKRVEVCSLLRSTSGVEGCAKTSEWGLKKLTSKSIIYMNLLKPNNKLINA
jgi:hypothetical protein